MTNLLLISALVIYIVDLSGFTDSWSMKPFDCSQCMTWWTGLAYLALSGQFTLPMIAFVAALAFLSYPIGQVFIFIREGLNFIIDKLTGWML